MSKYYDQQRADFLRAEEQALDPDKHDPWAPYPEECEVDDPEYSPEMEEEAWEDDEYFDQEDFPIEPSESAYDADYLGMVADDEDCL